MCQGFSWSIVIEHGTLLERCAIDALLTVQSIDHDMYTYVTSDKGAWNEFLLIRKANKRKLDKEELDHYRY